MNIIVLHGELAKFGPEFKLAVRTPAEAVRAIALQIKEFAAILQTGTWAVIREMANGELALDKDELLLGMSNSKIHIMPVVEGSSKKGIGKIILGVALVGVTIATGGFGGVALAGLSMKTAGIMVGLALVFSGASLLLTPTPKMDDAENDASWLFSGDINPAGQNFAVPLTYGLDRVRSIPIATQIVTNQVRIGASQTYNNPHTGIGGGGAYGGGGHTDYGGQVRNV